MTSKRPRILNAAASAVCLWLTLGATEVQCSQFVMGYTSLRLLDSDGSRTRLPISASVRTTDDLTSSPGYELRVSVAESLRPKCRAAVVRLRYQHTISLRDIRTGASIAPGTTALSSMALALSNPDGTDLPVTFDIAGRSEIVSRGLIPESNCRMAVPNAQVMCTILWAPKAEVECFE